MIIGNSSSSSDIANLITQGDTLVKDFSSIANYITQSDGSRLFFFLV